MADPNGQWAVAALPILGQLLVAVGTGVVAVVTSPIFLIGVGIAAVAYVGYCGYQIYQSKHSVTTSSSDVAGDTSTSNQKEVVPYSHLEDGPKVGPGKDFTKTQKQKMINENKKRNGGKVKSDDQKDFHETLIPPKKSISGVKPRQDEWQIDHIIPKSKGGTNSYENARVISRELNRLKWDN